MRGVARQYTTFQGGIPDALRDFIREHPEARQLIVSTAQFRALLERRRGPFRFPAYAVVEQDFHFPICSLPRECRKAGNE